MCKVRGDGIRAASIESGVERIEAHFRGNGFEPHRHDTYAIGLTLNGVQTFSYRGAERYSLPGQIIVLHPDELHDGGAGTENGLLYRMVYVPPELVAAALGWPVQGVPFVAHPVIEDVHFRQGLIEVLQDLDLEMGTLKLDGFVSTLATSLNRHSKDRPGGAGLIDWKSMQRCRDYLIEHSCLEVRSSDLEEIADLDRYALSRHFRRAFGTSPHRFQVLRRLDRVRQAIRDGEDLASAAVASGFADQSHMTRHFKQTYGMTPGYWRKLCGMT